MTYLLFGSIAGELADSVPDPIADVAVRFYRLEDEHASPVTSTTAIAMLTADQLRAKEGRWLGQARTNDRGEFSLDLAGQTLLGPNARKAYGGEALEIDVFCGTPPRLVGAAAREEVQFTAAKVQPQWARGGEVSNARLEIRVAHADWRDVRSAIDAWAITGRVIHRLSGTPIADARVSAFDADLMLDDALGMAVTDSEGRFQIEFRSIAFRGSRLREIEWEHAGPDLFFHVAARDGSLLIAEDRSVGSDRARRDALNLTHVDILVDG